jgi:type I restriction enzyme S subunit
MAELDTIDVELKDLKIVKSIFARHLPYKQVWAYGSRVKWTATHTSDLDCIVFGATDSEIADAKEAFDESDIPFEVQLLNWENIPEDFRENIREQYFILRNNGDWREDILGTVLEIKYGKDHKFLANGSIPVYGSGGVIRYVNDSIYADESILIPRKGSLNNILYKNKPFWTVDTMFWSKIDKKMVVPKFLYYQLTIIDYTSLNVGSAVPSLTAPVINQIKISLPPLPEQKAIASVLSSLDDKIDLLHRQNKTLESIAETLFRKWFIEEARDDWEEVSLSQLANIICGKTPSKKKPEYFDGNVPFIKIPDMHGNIYITQTADSLTEEGENSQRNKTIPSFSICVSCIATVGLVSMTIAESQTNQQINTIIPYKEIYRYYLFLYMKNSFDLLQAMGSGGTATLNINTSSFSKMNIDKPDDITLENFSNKVSLIFNKILSNQKQIKTLESLRDTLLPKLISGNIRVEYEAAA